MNIFRTIIVPANKQSLSQALTAVGMQRWDAAADERLFWAVCADERTRNPSLTCEFTKPT